MVELTCQEERSENVAIHLYNKHFDCFTGGEWHTHGVFLLSSMSPPSPSTIIPPPASSSTSIPTLSAAPTSESGSTSTGIIASASASPNRPSRTNGVPRAPTICAWPVVSAPGATCPPLPGIVDGICAAWSAGGSEKNGIFWWFQSTRI